MYRDREAREREYALREMMHPKAPAKVTDAGIAKANTRRKLEDLLEAQRLGVSVEDLR